MRRSATVERSPYNKVRKYRSPLRVVAAMLWRSRESLARRLEKCKKTSQNFVNISCNSTLGCSVPRKKSNLNAVRRSHCQLFSRTLKVSGKTVPIARTIRNRLSLDG